MATDEQDPWLSTSERSIRSLFLAGRIRNESSCGWSGQFESVTNVGFNSKTITEWERESRSKSMPSNKQVRWNLRGMTDGYLDFYSSMSACVSPHSVSNSVCEWVCVSMCVWRLVRIVKTCTVRFFPALSLSLFLVFLFYIDSWNLFLPVIDRSPRSAKCSKKFNLSLCLRALSKQQTNLLCHSVRWFLLVSSLLLICQYFLCSFSFLGVFSTAMNKKSQNQFSPKR